MRGRVQYAAATGKAATLYHAPTVHNAMLWSKFSTGGPSASVIGTFYESTDELLARLHDTMTSVFNPEMMKGENGHVLPFGGKKMIFLGDPGQLKPVNGASIYEDSVSLIANSKTAASRQLTMTVKGQMLYRKYLMPYARVESCGPLCQSSGAYCRSNSCW